MTLSIPTIPKFCIQGQFNPAISNPLVEQILANLPFNFQNLTVLNIVPGSYTPANDSETIYTFGAGEKPNFLLITVDQPAVLSLNHSAPAAVIDGLPFSKTFVLAMPNLTTGTWTTLELDGSASGIAPMQQGVACNYTVIAVTGLVT
jgi:hypothetical protein